MVFTTLGTALVQSSANDSSFLALVLESLPTDPAAIFVLALVALAVWFVVRFGTE